MSDPKTGPTSTTLATVMRLNEAPASRGPAAPGLTVITGPQMCARFELDGTRRNFVAGREPAADIRIEDDTVSRRHAKFYAKVETDGSEQFWVTDLGSTNGVFVNEQRVQEAALQPGDKVHLGDVILRFEWLDQYDRRFHDKLTEKIRAAAVDPTTGLLTKRFFVEDVPGLTQEWLEHERGFGLILVDLDGFKGVNDRFGHAMGDRVLARVATLVKGQVRANDIAVRFGGDELVIVLPAADEADAKHVARRIWEAVRGDAWSELNPALSVTVSVGVVAWRTGDDLESLFRRADRALYQAKQAGRDRVGLAEDSGIFEAPT